MLRRIVKFLKENRKAQGTMEFGLCVTVFLFMTLGVLDLAKMSSVYMDLHYFNNKHLSALLSDSSLQHGGNGWGKHFTNVGDQKSMAYDLREHAFFCTEGGGRMGFSSKSSCQNDKHKVTIKKFQTEIHKGSGVSTSGGLKAGTVVCTTVEASFKPFFSGSLGGKDPTVSSTACGVLEYDGASL